MRFTLMKYFCDIATTLLETTRRLVENLFETEKPNANVRGRSLRRRRERILSQNYNYFWGLLSLEAIIELCLASHNANMSLNNANKNKLNLDKWQ